MNHFQMGLVDYDFPDDSGLDDIKIIEFFIDDKPLIEILDDCRHLGNISNDLDFCNLSQSNYILQLLGKTSTMNGLNIDFLFDIWAQAIECQKAIDDYANMLSFNFEELNYVSAWTSCTLAKQLTDWALSDEIFNTFSKKILIAVEDIDSLDEYQLDSYEYVLRLND